MQLRSATKKRQVEDVVHVGNGVYIRTTPSDTGAGRHIRWEYDQEIVSSPTPLASKVEFRPIPADSSAESFSSLFDGSLSSISSDGSCSSLFDDPTTSSAPSPEPTNHSQEMNREFLDFVARNTAQRAVPVTPNNTSVGPMRIAHSTPLRRIAKNPYPSRSLSSSSEGIMMSPSRPLQRTTAREWEVQPDSSIIEIGGKSAAPIPQAGTANKSFDHDDIFEREMQILMRRRENVLAGVSTIQNTNEENTDLDYDSLFMKAGPSTQPPTPRALGPHGTELIDESFRATPGELSTYPRQWITHQSTTLHSHPTELDVMDI